MMRACQPGPRIHVAAPLVSSEANSERLRPEIILVVIRDRNRDKPLVTVNLGPRCLFQSSDPHYLGKRHDVMQPQ
jgi:hypothetical protein